MSWSYHKTGRSETVRRDAAERLAETAKHCAHIPAEAAAVRAFASAVDAACEAAPEQAFLVSGSGSAWVEGGKVRGMNFTAKIELIDLT
jgi:protein involved in temperature-dependent protein secretion